MAELRAGSPACSSRATVLDFWDIVVGIVGAIIAGWLLPLIGFVIVGGFIAAIVNAVIGAVILLLIIGLFKKG